MTAKFGSYSKNRQALERYYFSTLLNVNLNGNFRLGSLNKILANFNFLFECWEAPVCV